MRRILPCDHHLSLIGDLARRWHRLYCQLAKMQLSGDERVVATIAAVEDDLERAWRRRRATLITEGQAAMQSADLVDAFQERVHVRPLC